MDIISPEIAKEIDRRLAAGPYGSVDELLTVALRALDDATQSSLSALEQELLKGLEGKDVEMTSDDWDGIEQEAIRLLESKKGR